MMPARLTLFGSNGCASVADNLGCRRGFMLAPVESRAAGLVCGLNRCEIRPADGRKTVVFQMGLD